MEGRPGGTGAGSRRPSQELLLLDLSALLGQKARGLEQSPRPYTQAGRRGRGGEQKVEPRAPAGQCCWGARQGLRCHCARPRREEALWHRKPLGPACSAALRGERAGLKEVIIPLWDWGRGHCPTENLLAPGTDSWGTWLLSEATPTWLSLSCGTWPGHEVAWLRDCVIWWQHERWACCSCQL